MNNSDIERFHQLMMGAVDGELGDKESAEFERLLGQNPDFQDEYKKYKELKEMTSKVKFKSPPQEIWDRYWLGIYNRIERSIGWVVFSFGFIILLTYFGFLLVETVLRSEELVLIVKIGILCLIGGLATLLVSVIREKFFVYRTDPYKEIRR